MKRGFAVLVIGCVFGCFPSGAAEVAAPGSRADVAVPWALALSGASTLLAAAAVAMLMAHGKRQAVASRHLDRQIGRLDQRIGTLEATASQSENAVIREVRIVQTSLLDLVRRITETTGPSLDARETSPKTNPERPASGDLETALCRLGEELGRAAGQMRLPPEAALDEWIAIATQIRCTGVPASAVRQFELLMETARTRLRVELIDPPLRSSVNPLQMEIDGPPLGVVAEVLHPGLQSADGVIRLARVRSMPAEDV